MECKFWVGQKVVFVNTNGLEEVLDNSELGIELDCVYEVSRLTVVGTEVFVGLAGLGSCAWRQWRFRPATDITIFKEIVAKVKSREKVTS